MVNGIDTEQKKIMVIAKVALKMKSLKNKESRWTNIETKFMIVKLMVV